MKAIRQILTALFAAVMLAPMGLAEQPSLSPEQVHLLMNAKSAYVVTGHVRSHKRGFLSKDIVDETPFAEPTQKELVSWGRFQLVPDPKEADLIIRVYMTGESQSTPVISPYVTGSVDMSRYFIVLDVIDPSTKKVLWYDSKNTARSWSTRTAINGLVKRLREFLEQQPPVPQKFADSNAMLGSAGPTLPMQDSAPGEEGRREVVVKAHEAALRLVRALGIKERMATSVNTRLEDFIASLKGNPDVRPEFVDEWRRRMTARMDLDDLAAMAARAYERRFTAEELDQIRDAASSTKEGKTSVLPDALKQKFEKNSVAMQSEVAGDVAQLFARRAGEVSGEILKEHHDWIRKPVTKPAPPEK